jgi:hypothetical protein
MDDYNGPTENQDSVFERVLYRAFEGGVYACITLGWLASNVSRALDIFSEEELDRELGEYERDREFAGSWGEDC